MILKCKCGNYRPSQPWRSSAEQAWICDDCRKKGGNVQSPISTVTERPRVQLVSPAKASRRISVFKYVTK